MIRKILCNNEAIRYSPKIYSYTFKILRNNFSVTGLAFKKSKSCCPPDCGGPAVIVPKNCREVTPPIMEPCCKVAIVIGGTNNGFGYVAADQLLDHGAKKVILADFDLDVGIFAANRLNQKYGNNRAKFVQCDIKNACQIEALFDSAAVDDPVTIMFNDLDGIQYAPNSCTGCCILPSPRPSLAQQCTTLGYEKMSKGKTPSDSSSIILNCASILGIMGWPNNPEVVYCHQEHAVHVTYEIAKVFSFEETGVRTVALCPSKKKFENIGLPHRPSQEDIIDFETCGCRLCVPDISKDPSRMGEALNHLMSQAKSGSTWLVEPPFSLRERPLLLDLSKTEGLTEKEKQKRESQR